MKNKRNLFGAVCLAAVLAVSTPEVSLAEEVTVSATEVEDSWEERAEDTYNLLLIGVDRRNDSWNGNSDVMVLVTVNPEKEAIYMTSFLRDLYADIEDLGVQKLNAACAYGGADLCVQTIEENYQVKIDKSDFGRTDRQRAVLVALMDKMQDAGFDSIDNLLFDVLPSIEHDLSMIKILDLASKLPDWLGYSFEQQHIPYDGMYYSQNEILMPDMEETLDLLLETIY